MTEAEWIVCQDPGRMLGWLGERPHVYYPAWLPAFEDLVHAVGIVGRILGLG